jgi:hypothetical protein
VAQGVVEGVLAGKGVWGFEGGEAGEGMLRAGEWEEEDEDRSVGGEGWGGGCLLPSMGTVSLAVSVVFSSRTVDFRERVGRGREREG